MLRMGSNAGSYVMRKHTLQMFENSVGSRDSVVGVATGYGLDDQGVGVRVPVESRIFLYSMSSRPALEST
jgi:hypothetical protein